MQNYTPLEYYESIGQYLTSPFGPRTGVHAGFHNGIDIGGIPCNAPVRTPFGGKIRAARRGHGSWGNVVVLLFAPGVLQLTAHHNAFRCKAGDIVNRGDIISTNGGTNNTPDPVDCHIHYEIRRDDGSTYGTEPRDPATFRLYCNKFSTGQWVQSTLENLRLNVRSQPNTSSSVINSLPPGENVQLVDDERNGIYGHGHYWWRIAAGWIAGSFLHPAPVPLPDQSPEQLPDFPDTKPDLYERVRTLENTSKQLRTDLDGALKAINNAGKALAG